MPKAPILTALVATALLCLAPPFAVTDRKWSMGTDLVVTGTAAEPHGYVVWSPIWSPPDPHLGAVAPPTVAWGVLAAELLAAWALAAAWVVIARAGREVPPGA